MMNESEGEELVVVVVMVVVVVAAAAVIVVVAVMVVVLMAVVVVVMRRRRWWWWWWWLFYSFITTFISHNVWIVYNVRTSKIMHDSVVTSLGYSSTMLPSYSTTLGSLNIANRAQVHGTYLIGNDHSKKSLKYLCSEQFACSTQQRAH